MGLLLRKVENYLSPWIMIVKMDVNGMLVKTSSFKFLVISYLILSMGHIRLSRWKLLICTMHPSRVYVLKKTGYLVVVSDSEMTGYLDRMIWGDQPTKKLARLNHSCIQNT
jgi:hypothetical protein